MLPSEALDFLGVNTREEEKVENYPDAIKAAKRPIPPILVFVYMAFVVWAIVYVVVIGIKGGPF